MAAAAAAAAVAVAVVRLCDRRQRGGDDECEEQRKRAGASVDHRAILGDAPRRLVIDVSNWGTSRDHPPRRAAPRRAPASTSSRLGNSKREIASALQLSPLTALDGVQLVVMAYQSGLVA